MSAHEFELVTTIPARNTLGECILWNANAATVWWTDIHARVLHEYSPDTAELTRHPVPERLCAFGFVEGDDRLICAFASGFALLDLRGGNVEWLYRPEADLRGTRFNDGRVDRQGRFWSGTMVEGEAVDSAGDAVRGSLYWISSTGRGRALGDIKISNSLAFSPDGSTLYFADSPAREILAFALDSDNGRLGARRVLTRIDAPGVPDGSAVDADGCLWNAEWGGSRVVRYAPDGRVLTSLNLPVTQPTCVCFGGEHLDQLYVTTATEHLSDASLRGQPEAGNVLVYQTIYRGLPESSYRL